MLYTPELSDRRTHTVTTVDSQVPHGNLDDFRYGSFDVSAPKIA